MTPTTVVLDASAFIRAVRRPGPTEEALDWLERISSGETLALAPDLVHAEVGNALLGYVRAGVVDAAPASSMLNVLRELALRTTSCADLAQLALVTARETGLSVYDACYVVLAEQGECPLLTADRRLAAAVADSILLE